MCLFTPVLDINFVQTHIYPLIDLRQRWDSNPRSLSALSYVVNHWIAMPVAPVLRSFVGVYSGRMALSMSLMTHSQPAPALLYQHVKEPGDCTVATRVHSSIPYGEIGSPYCVGTDGLEPPLILARSLPGAPFAGCSSQVKQRTSQLAAYVIFAYGSLHSVISVNSCLTKNPLLTQISTLAGCVLIKNFRS